MNRKKILTIFSILLLSPNIFFLSFNLSIPIIEFVTSQESQYYASFSAADEDYVNFSSMEGFTNGTSWSIVQRIKLPENPSVFGWSWFRGSAWEDREGDIALRLDTNEEHDYQITFWIQKGGWNSLRMDRSQNGLTLQNNTWYDIIVLFDRPSTTYKLYVEGELADSLVLNELADATNTNPLFFGGQYCAPSFDKGDLYSECDTEIAHLAWYQRVLTIEEIENYDGTIDNTDEDLFFSTEITDSEILDASGNNHDGINGNSPEFIEYSTTVKTGYSPFIIIGTFGVALIVVILRKKRKYH